MDLLKDIQNSLTVAMQKGLKFDEWKENITPTLAKKGWLGKVYVVNPKNGEVKKINVNSKRLKTIYETNMRTANAKHEYNSMVKAGVKYLRYVATLDSKTRPAHAKLHNLILPLDDPFWDINYPPNAWRCRCKVEDIIDDKELRQRGLSLSPRPKVNIANKDWAFHVGKTDTQKRLMDVYKNKVDKIKDEKLKDKALKHISKHDFLKMQSDLNNAIVELLINKNHIANIIPFKVGKISPEIAKKAKEILDIDVEDAYIMEDKHGILHIRAERKEQYKQDLRMDELKSIVKVLNSDKTPVSVDTDKRNIIFWFDDKEDSTKINKIVVDLNYKLKKYGVTNYMVTVGKVDKDDGMAKDYVKIR